jgi:NAD(P)-dependent dehydrogenase (short-subunit alcohol dehydrogenase family)
MKVGLSLSRVFDLGGKVALVTGSTMGIGLATARVLAKAVAHVTSAAASKRSVIWLRRRCAKMA